MRIKAGDYLYWDGAVAVVLLGFLSVDSYRLSKANAFDDPSTALTLLTFESGKSTFDEQYAHYKSIDRLVTGLAKSNVIYTSQLNGGLNLDQHSDCFEVGRFTRHYEFINDRGISKLRQEWPGIWTQNELDKYL